ncbi:transaldolase [Kineococcus rhizosphaerae]|uniref:Transaldolase n=1 Tax=Kineococcus rhizosphaerae TaxID=559628 RepID=A0A2T0QKX5_9ACTN|nr:transaldolase [Kineococcus rhizosphaerae]PRY04972.1 transaldolase [Kineococcus rhizosphaerae]
MTDHDSSSSLRDLQRHGVSVWLDDLSRELTDGGELGRLVEAGVLGVTSNPTIFATALSKGDRYTDQVKELVAVGADTEEAVFQITTEDVRKACDVLKPVFDRTDGLDGRVSLEVDPRQARDTAGTEVSARKLWKAVDRQNLYIKIPATVEGLAAISTALSEGISVNVTLIFSLDRYRAVMQAFLTGLEQAKQNGHDISKIESVASFFVSRVDTEIDKRLEEIGTDEAKALRSKAGLANARLAYQAYEEVFSTPRWQVLKESGARAQRPLWASTGVKNPDLPDTLYVTGLVAPNTVNTMPGKTLDATIDHAEVTGDTIRGSYGEAQAVLDDLERLGVSYTDVVEFLETDGLDKFEKSWTELLQTVTDELERVRTQVEAQ